MVTGPYVSHRLCTHLGNFRSALFTRCTTPNDPHGNEPLGGEHSAVNGIFVHPMYRPVQLNGSGPRTSPTGSVHILGSPVAPCTLGVRLRITLMAMHHTAVNTLLPTEFSYTHCTDLYTSMAAGPVRLPKAVYTYWEVL